DLQQVERDALRRLRTDAGQLAEGVDQFLDRVGVVGHEVPPNRPPRSSPSPRPASGLASACSAVTLDDASRSAASTRSSSSETSSGSTASGSMTTRWNSYPPVTVTVTAPPPACPSTTVAAMRVWLSASCACMFCAAP